MVHLNRWYRYFLDSNVPKFCSIVAGNNYRTPRTPRVFPPYNPVKFHKISQSQRVVTLLINHVSGYGYGSKPLAPKKIADYYLRQYPNTMISRIIPAERVRATHQPIISSYHWIHSFLSESHHISHGFPSKSSHIHIVHHVIPHVSSMFRSIFHTNPCS